MEQTKTYDNYPCWIILVSNFVSIAIYLIGAVIMSQVGLIWLFAYLLYILWLEIRVMGRSCVNCHYYGKYCAFGRGKLSSLFFRKGDPQDFMKRKIGWKDILPDFLVSIIPLVVGVALLILNFNWFLLTLIVLLAILTSAGNAFVRGSLACRYCKQRESGCPAEELFSRNKK